MSNSIEMALLALVRAIGHTQGCPQVKAVCLCGKAATLALAHGEACQLLRERGLLK